MANPLFDYEKCYFTFMSRTSNGWRHVIYITPVPVHRGVIHIRSALDDMSRCFRLRSGLQLILACMAQRQLGGCHISVWTLICGCRACKTWYKVPYKAMKLMYSQEILIVITSFIHVRVVLENDAIDCIPKDH